MLRDARRTMAGALLCVAALSACGRLTEERHRSESAAFLKSLTDAGAAGRIGSLEGHVYLLHPNHPSPLRDWSVTLLPLPPDQEAAIQRAHEQYVRHGREPLPIDRFREARQLLERVAARSKELGHGELIRTTKTDAREGKFVFSDVPEGRWLLTAELPAKSSVLLWARPVTVTAGELTKHRLLNDVTIWLDGLTPE